MADLFRRAVAVSRPRAASIESPLTPLTSESLISLVGAGSASAAGRAVSPQTALGISAVWRSVNLISTTCGGLPMGAYKDGPDDVRLRVTTGAAARLLANPHPDLTPLELWELVYGSLCLWGNAYLLKLKNQLGQLAELWWINPARVRVFRLDEGPDAGQKRYVVDGDTDQPYSDAKILHIPGFGYDGTCGVSPIRAAREGLGLALAAEEYGGRFFGNGSLATGVLQTDQFLDQDDAKKLKELWRLGGSGLDSAHDIRVMGSGAKFTQLTIPNEDAQFLETREFQVTEVARWFGIPPHLLMQTEKSTSWGTGIEQQNIGLITFTLAGYTGRVEQRMTKTVAPETVYVKVNMNALLRGDSASRAEFYSKMFALGALSPNDIRRFEDQPPVPDGNTYFVPLNYGELGAEPVPAPAVAPPAPEPAPAEPVPSEEETADA